VQADGSPGESKPGPRLALAAGTRTRTGPSVQPIELLTQISLSALVTPASESGRILGPHPGTMWQRDGYSRCDATSFRLERR
jgi:hypothetical protein